MKRTICILLSLLLVLTGLVGLGLTNVFAAGGTDGSITWDYNESTKTLTFSGTGVIPDYENPDKRPWRSVKECETVVIGNGVTGVGANCVYAFSSLQSVTIADSVKTIGICAFQNCGKLVSVSLGKNVTNIGGSAFSQCYKLATVTGGSSVSVIGDNAFYSCQALQSFTLSDKLTYIGKYAFENCYKLQDLAIPASVKTIGERAFFKNTGMQTVSIPDGITSIGNQTFLGCTGLQTVSIPASVTSIGDYAFVNCTALTAVNYAGTEQEWNAVSKGSYVFGLYDGEYTERPANEMPTFHFLAAGVKVTLYSTVMKKPITNSGGTVSGSGTYEKGRQVAITATPAEGYVFDGWYGVHSVEGRLTTLQYNCAIQTIVVDADVVLAALFVKATSSDYSVTVTATEGGTVFGGGIFHPGQTAQLIAKADAGWHFVGWFDGGTKLSGSANYAFDVTKNTTLTAKFEKGAESKQPKVTIQNFTASSKKYDYRSSITFTADVENPIPGGEIHWFVDAEDVGTGDSYKAENVKKGFTLQAKYLDGSSVLSQTEIETVNVNTGFFARLKAFFRSLFGRLPKEVQEHFGVEFVERALPH